MKDLNVLITAAGNVFMPGTTACIRNNGERSIRLVGADMSEDAGILKMCDAVQSGGHAKMVIQEGEVKVNGEICTMRGKKLRTNDKVEFEKKIYIVE